MNLSYKNFTYEDYKLMTSHEYAELLKCNPPMDFIRQCNDYGMRQLKEGAL